MSGQDFQGDLNYNRYPEYYRNGPMQGEQERSYRDNRKHNNFRNGDRRGNSNNRKNNRADDGLTKRERRSRDRWNNRQRKKGAQEQRNQARRSNQNGNNSKQKGFQKFKDIPPNQFQGDPIGPVNESTNFDQTLVEKVTERVAPTTNNIPSDVGPVAKPSGTEKESSTSSSSSHSDGSEDSAVRSLKNAVANSLQNKDSNKDDALQKEQKGNAGKSESTLKEDKQKDRAKQEEVKNVKREPKSKSSSSSSSSSSDDSSSASSSEDDAVAAKKPSSVDDVICLGNLEKFEDLVEDEETPVNSKCILCDKTDHISFHCQMICKNCGGKYHGLKDCPKPANLSTVFSNFIQFCLKQSCKYNPNTEFAVDENVHLIPTTSISAAGHSAGYIESERLKRRHKTRSETPRSIRKRQQASSSASSDSNSDDSSTRKKRRRDGRSEGHKTPVSMPFTVPYPNAFNPSFGFAPSSAVNPLLAFSHMMGFNPASMGGFGNTSVTKDL